MTGLLGGALVARWDDDAGVWVVTGWAAGPAGVSGLELAPGLTVLVDHARPWRLAELQLTPADDDQMPPATAELLSRLLGAEGAEQLLLLRDSGEDRAVRLGHRPGGDADFHRFVLLGGLTDELGDPAGATIARLEAVAAATAAGVGDLDRVRELARLGLDGLPGAAWPKQVVGLQHLAARVLGEQLERVDVDVTTRTTQAVTGLEDFLAGRVKRLRGKQVAAVPAAADVAVDATLDGSYVTAEVRPATAARNLWLVVVAAADGVPLAWVPFGVDGRCEAVVPSGLSAGDMVAEATHDPKLAAISTVVRETRLAIVAGRRAARFDRLRGREFASTYWWKCAERWAKAKADQAELAERFVKTAPHELLSRSDEPPPADVRLLVDEHVTGGP